jgi:precorrin-2 dehydrogenase/sirohydrochlorin ferrochelatase
MFYPAFLNLNGKKAVVIGGGEIAERKVLMLLECGAVVTVVSPDVTPELESLARTEKITVFPRRYQRGDCVEAFLVFAATNDPTMHKTVYEDARKAGALVNTADEPGLCDFIAPAILRRGDLTVAISTNAKSPGLAAHLRRRLSDVIGPEYEELLDLLAEIRPEIRVQVSDFERRKELHYRIIESGVLDILQRGDREEAQRVVRRVVEDYIRQEQPIR